MHYRYIPLIAKIALCVLFLASVVIMVKPISFSFWPDFNIYYHSSLSLFHHINPYVSKEIFVGGYLYPPVSLFLFYPLLFFPTIIAGKIWIGISVICLFVSLWLLLKIYSAHKDIYVLLLSGILVCNFFPVKFTLGMGQLNMIILLLITLSMYFYNRKNKKITGMLLGTSLVIKYFPSLIFFWMLTEKKWNIFLLSLLTITLLFFAGGIIVGKDTMQYFLQQIFFGLTTSIKIDYYNQALSGFLFRSLPFFSTRIIFFIQICISLLLLFITTHTVSTHPTKSTLLPINLFITLSLLINSFSWQHQFVLLLIPFFVSYFSIKKLHLTWKYYTVLAIVYCLVATNIKNPHIVPVLFESHVFYGALLLWGFDIYLLKKFPIKTNT